MFNYYKTIDWNKIIIENLILFQLVLFIDTFDKLLINMPHNIILLSVYLNIIH